MAKNESVIRRQDFFTCLNYINRNPIGEFQLMAISDRVTR
jgi:hypothetical protein